MGTCPGRLNPDWVEALMGLTIGSTDLGSGEWSRATNSRISVENFMEENE